MKTVKFEESACNVKNSEKKEEPNEINSVG